MVHSISQPFCIRWNSSKVIDIVYESLRKCHHFHRLFLFCLSIPVVPLLSQPVRYNLPSAFSVFIIHCFFRILAVKSANEGDIQYLSRHLIHLLWHIRHEVCFSNNSGMSSLERYLQHVLFDWIPPRTISFPLFRASGFSLYVPCLPIFRDGYFYSIHL